MEIEDLIACIEAATVKMEVMRHVDYEGASPEWIEFVDPTKLIAAVRELSLTDSSHPKPPAASSLDLPA